MPGARGVYAASRSERSASPAEEYPGSSLAADAPTRCSMGDPGVITRLIPASPRPFSLPEAATSVERQPISMTRQPRRSTVTPVAPPVTATSSNSLQLLRAGASPVPPQPLQALRPRLYANKPRRSPMDLKLLSRPTAVHGSRGLYLSCPLGHPLSHPSRSYAAVLLGGREEQRSPDDRGPSLLRSRRGVEMTRLQSRRPPAGGKAGREPGPRRASRRSGPPAASSDGPPRRAAKLPCQTPARAPSMGVEPLSHSGARWDTELRARRSPATSLTP